METEYSIDRVIPKLKKSIFQICLSLNFNLFYHTRRGSQLLNFTIWAKNIFRLNQITITMKTKMKKYKSERKHKTKTGKLEQIIIKSKLKLLKKNHNFIKIKISILVDIKLK